MTLGSLLLVLGLGLAFVSAKIMQPTGSAIDLFVLGWIVAAMGLGVLIGGVV